MHLPWGTRGSIDGRLPWTPVFATVALAYIPHSLLPPHLMFRLFALTAILIAIGAYFLSTRENLTADVVDFWRQPMVQVTPDSTLPPRPDLEPDEATAVPGQRRLRTLPAESNPDVDIPDLLDGEAQMERLGPIIVNTDGVCLSPVYASRDGHADMSTSDTFENRQLEGHE